MLDQSFHIAVRSIVFLAQHAETFVELGVLQKELIVFFGRFLCFRLYLVDLPEVKKGKKEMSGLVYVYACVCVCVCVYLPEVKKGNE